MTTKGNGPDREVCIVDDMSIVIASSFAVSEAYLLPDIETRLSECSASSSVYVETGAREIRHLRTKSAEEDEDLSLPLDRPANSATHEVNYPLASTSSLKHDGETIFDAPDNVQNSYDDLSWLGDGATSLPLKDAFANNKDGSIEASSITANETLSIEMDRLRSHNDFSQCLMPAIRVPINQQRRILSSIPSTTGRYQRPVDSLLIRQKQHCLKPSVVSFKSREWARDTLEQSATQTMKVNPYNRNISQLDGEDTENLNPRSPGTRAMTTKGVKGDTEESN